MNLTDYVTALTGLTSDVLFSGLARPVAFDTNPDGSPTLAVWNEAVTGKPKPSDADLAAALLAPTPAKILLDYASGRQNALLAGVWSFDVAPAGQPAHAVTTKLDDRGQFAMMKVQGWLTLNAQTPGATMPYSNVDFSATTLTVAEADSLVEQAAALDIKSYTLLNQVQAGVTASPPTITTTEQIDRVFAGLTA